MQSITANDADRVQVSNARLPDRSGVARRGTLGLIAGGFAAGLIQPSPALAVPAPTWPDPAWVIMSPTAAGFSSTKFTSAVNYAKSKGGSGFVSRYGYRIGAWGSATQKYDVKSATKSIGSLLISLGITKGLVQLGNTALSRLNPEFGVPPDANATAGPGWRNQITLQDLLDHRAGFLKRGGFEPLVYAPKAYYLYSDGGTNWLADIMTVAFKADLQEVLRQNITAKIGIASAEFHLRSNQYRPTTIRGLPRREFGSGLNITARSFARIGLMLLRNGQWKGGTQLVSAEYLSQARQSRPELANTLSFDTKTQTSALVHYNRLFWNNTDGIAPNLPRDVFFAWGLNNNHVFIVPSLDLVVVRIGTTSFGGTYGSVNTLLGNFVKAVVPSTTTEAALVASSELPQEKLTPDQRRRLRERPFPSEDE